MKYNAKKIADELLKGNGYFVVPKLFQKKMLRLLENKSFLLLRVIKRQKILKKI